MHWFRLLVCVCEILILILACTFVSASQISNRIHGVNFTEPDTSVNIASKIRVHLDSAEASFVAPTPPLFSSSSSPLLLHRELATACTPYSTSNTDSVSHLDTYCAISACPGQIITATMCDSGGYCSGDTLLRLVLQRSDQSYWEVASSDDLCGLCSGMFIHQTHTHTHTHIYIYRHILTHTHTHHTHTHHINKHTPTHTPTHTHS